MRHVSLFSGIGGDSLAARWAGFDTVLFCEIAPYCRRVLAKHWPGVPIHEDIRTLSDDTLAGLGAVDLLTGGFPCQDLSVAGKRAGLAGERSGLFFEVMRVAAVLRPRWLVLENVPGLLSSNGGRDMGVVLDSLAELGYGWAYRVLDAQYFGVAQRRRRVFIVGHLGVPWSAPGAVLFEPESSERHPAPRREAREGTSPSVIKGAAIGRQPTAGPQYGEVLTDDSCYTLNCTEVHAVGVNLAPDVAYALSARNAQDGPERSAATLIPTVASAITASAGHHGHSSPRGDGTDNLVGYQATGDGCWRAGLGPLSAGDDNGTNHVVAFSSKDSGADAVTDLAPTLRSMNYDQSHLNGGGQVAVAISLRGRDGGATAEMGSDVSTSLRASQGGGDKPHVLHYTHDYNQDRIYGPDGPSPALTAADSNRARNIMTDMAVRRLTPLECERLQGFPDGWTAGESDSARYRMLGNAICVPVAAWIATRLAAYTVTAAASGARGAG